MGGAGIEAQPLAEGPGAPDRAPGSQSPARQWWTSHRGAGPQALHTSGDRAELPPEAAPRMLSALEADPLLRAVGTVERGRVVGGSWAGGCRPGHRNASPLSHGRLAFFIEWRGQVTDGGGSRRATQPGRRGGGPQLADIFPSPNTKHQGRLAVGSPRLLGGPWIVNLGNLAEPVGSSLGPDTALPRSWLLSPCGPTLSSITWASW